MLQFLIKAPNFGKFDQPFPYAIHIDRDKPRELIKGEKINKGKIVLLSWLIALFDTLIIFLQSPIKANNNINQQFHRLNRRNHLNFIHRGRE